LVASVERKSLPDLVASLISGKLRYAVAELAALPGLTPKRRRSTGCRV
jgi:hypothetical protein